MAVKRRGAEQPSSSEDQAAVEFVWTPEKELELFEALIFHKPAGLAKHFQMALVLNRLQASSNADMRGITAAAVWQKMGTLYNLEAADQVENKTTESTADEFHEFSLPIRDYQSAINDLKKQEKLPAEVETMRTPTVSAAPPPATASKRPTRSTPSTSKRRK